MFGPELAHSPGFSGNEYHRSSKASRREDLEMQQPVACRDSASVHFDPTLPSMLSTALIGHQIVQMCQPREKRLLAPLRMMEAFHREQLPLDGVVGLISQGTRHRHLRVCEDRIPPRLLVLEPAPHALAVGCPRRGGDMVGNVA
jgi:hypothetical protein